MSNTATNQDAATLALWRAAEAGEFGEVQAVLANVADIDARNEHGVTALMRAAQRGHARVVRLLLLHGADANIIRNDKFTALSLAAFFGHTEVVKVLMEHGADSNASTRHGTSPDMWATARTFNEVVDQLKEPTPTANVTPVESRPVTAAIVRTLKDPPEIWDLVHEAPRGFKASSTFVEHLHSRRGLVFGLATVAVLMCASVVGVLMLRGAEARNESESQEVVNHTVPAPVTAPAPAPASVVEPPPVAPVATENVKAETGQRRRSHSWGAGSREFEGEPATTPLFSDSVQRIQNQNKKTDALNEKTDVRVQTGSGSPGGSSVQAGSSVKADSVTSSNSKSSSPLSPQLITPAKNVAPKSKVIQWP